LNSATPALKCRFASSLTSWARACGVDALAIAIDLCHLAVPARN
jgi:hypothetical protein